jgi:hypothetical protein
MLRKLRDIMGKEAVDQMLGAQFDVSSGHEMLSLMVPDDVHKKLHGPIDDDFMNEAINCSYCLNKLIQYIYAKHTTVGAMNAIKHKWLTKKMEEFR